MKTWKKIVRILVLVLLIVPAAALVAVQIPAVQTALVGKVTETLSKDLAGDVRVGKVMLSFPNNLILKDVYVIQGADDTLAHLGKVLASVKTTSLLFSQEARIRRVSIEDSKISIHHINDSTTNLAALLAPLKNRPPKETTGGLPWETIRAGRLTLKNIDFSTDSLHLQDIHLSARDIRYGETASARIDRLTLREENLGLDVQACSLDAFMDSTGIRADNLIFNDGHSDLQADVKLGFNDFSDFSDFLNKVQLDATLRDTHFDFQSLRPVVPGNLPAIALNLDGQVQGPVSDLRSDQLHVESDSRGTTADLRFRLKGLPDINNTRFDAEVLRGVTSTEDLADILAAAQPGFNRATLTRYAPGETISLTAKANGTLANLKTTGQVTVGSMGSAAVDATLGVLRGFRAEGNLTTESLQLGRLLGNKSLGALTCQTDVSFSTSKKGLSATVEPLLIDNFSFNGYNYHDIVASAVMQDGMLQADVVSGDPNLQLVLHGDVELGGKGKENHYKIDMDLDFADLDALHFDKRENSSLRLALDADVTQTPQGAFLGHANFRSLQAMLEDQVFDIGDMALTSQREDQLYNVTLESTVARAAYDGSLFITDFIGRAVHLIKEEHLAPLFGKARGDLEEETRPDEFGHFHLQTLELQPLLDFFAPGLYVARESHVGINLDGHEMTGTVTSGLAAFGKNILRNIQGRIVTEGELFLADFDVEQLQSGSLTAENLTLDARADSTMIDLRAGFHNEDGSGNRADLHTRAFFLDPETDGYLLRADILPSTLAVADNEWEINPASVYYRDKHIRIDNFALVNGEQGLLVDGVIGETPEDKIRVRLNYFDLGLANSFLSTPLNLQGLLTGEGEAFALLGPDKGVLLDLQGRQISADDIDVGDVRLASSWDDDNKRFNFLVDNTRNGLNPLSATAWYRPKDKQANLDLQMDEFQVGVFEPILASLFSDMSGTASGHITAAGPIDKLSIKSEGTQFNDFKFKLDFTQVEYTANGPFTVSDNGVTFDDISLQDIYGRTGRLSGGIPYNHFQDIRLNVRIDLNNNLVLNTNSRDNDSFYGKAFADGNIRVTGTLDKVRLGLNITPQRYTVIHIPLGKSAKNGKSLLTFINQEEKKVAAFDSLLIAKQMVKDKKAGKGTDVNVNLRLNATPDAEIQLEIDKTTGDILKARGNGQIGITVEGEKFDIKGDYRVDSGNYHFGMLGFTARDFSINPGGTIAFVGDVMQSDLDLTATYRTKASISPLIADSTAVSMRRTVDCGISLSGKLANPDIKFNIDIPDLDPTTQSRVQSALNTEDKRMKQALALLISGGFVPDEQSGIVNNTTLLYANASEMMASQLNNIFRQLDIPLDLGFNYQPSENGRNIFDVAVSTQLFNNRVIINGNIGNRQYLSSSASDIVGDLDIEIKLNRQGQLRLTLFSHSADQYSNYLDLSQRNGAGIVYQEDFNSVADLWRKIFRRKNNDEQQTFPDSDAPRRPRPE